MTNTTCRVVVVVVAVVAVVVVVLVLVNIGAPIITYNTLGVPYYNSSRMNPPNPILIVKALYYRSSSSSSCRPRGRLTGVDIVVAAWCLLISYFGWAILAASLQIPYGLCVCSRLPHPLSPRANPKQSARKLRHQKRRSYRLNTLDGKTQPA